MTCRHSDRFENSFNFSKFIIEISLPTIINRDISRVISILNRDIPIKNQGVFVKHYAPGDNKVG